jgi:hypothetical protein
MSDNFEIIDNCDYNMTDIDIKDDDFLSDETKTVNPNDKDLLNFLIGLQSQIINKTIDPSLYQKFGEFYMETKFVEKKVEHTEEELIKFIVLGWFIYCMVLKDKRFV